MSAAVATSRAFVVIHNGIHGVVTAGPSSFDNAGRELRDRIRAGWINSGWAWDSSQPMMNVGCPAGSVHDLAVVAAMLLITDPDLPKPAPDAIRLIGEVGLDGSVKDGIVSMPLQGVAVVVTRLVEIPALIAQAAAS